MKKRIISALLCISMLCAIFPVSVFAAEPTVPGANTAIVDQSLAKPDGTETTVKVGDTTYAVTVGTNAFSSISAALNSLKQDGTLILAPGTYSEQVVITKNVTVLGPKAGINPNVKGKNPTDDWTLNPKRGSGEAIITSNWHMGINAYHKEVYDCHKITVDGVQVSNSGMFRSNFGETGYIDLVYQNILVRNYAKQANGPFYCQSYYPNQKTNNYSRSLIAKDIRFEAFPAGSGFHLTVDSFDASGIYFDGASTGKMIQYVTVSTPAQKSDNELNFTIRDSMFRQKVNQVLNCNFSNTLSYNADIGNCKKISMNIINNMFIDNDSGVATNNNIIVPQIRTENVFFNITGNTFMQNGEVSQNFIAIHGATGILPLGEKFHVENNKFINIPTALNIPNSTSYFDLSGNYFETDKGVPAKPVIVGKDSTKWWYMDREMTKTSDSLAGVIDGVPNVGTVDTQNKTLTANTDKDTFEFTIKTSNYNELDVYSDAALTKSVQNPVHLYSETSTFYLKISSADRKNSVVYKATVKTSAPDKLSYDLNTEVRFMGRTYNENGNVFFNWSASGFEFRFKGSGAKAVIGSNAMTHPNTAYIKVYVDGVEQDDVELSKVSQTVILAKNLDASKEHTVKVLKRTNARASSAFVSSLKITDGEKLAPTVDKGRFIEFIGDSITVGYASMEGDYTSWSTSTEDVTKTYVEQIANAFNADYMVTAISGRGIVRNTGGDRDRLLPAIYGELDNYNKPGVPYDFARKADVVVINLGTNDASGNNSGLKPQDFRKGLKDFLIDVRAKNPDAEIIYAYGMMSTKFTADMIDVISELRQLGDEKISFLKLSTCASSERRLGHPTAEAYVSRGESIINKIEKTVGWKAYAEDTEPEETKAEQTTDAVTDIPNTTEVTTAAETEEKKKGCGSSIAPLASLTLIGTAAVALHKKKKEKDN